MVTKVTIPAAADLRGSMCAIMGLDGTGKSTQAAILLQSLCAKGILAQAVHHGKPVISGVDGVKTRIREPLIGLLKRAHVHRQYGSSNADAAGPRRRRLLGCVGPLIANWMILAGFCRSWYHRGRFGGSYLIYDRCFIDDVVKVRWRLGGGWRLGVWLMRFVPAPGRLVYLKLDRRLGYSRKKAPTCSFEEYYAKGDIEEEALAVAARVGWDIRVIPIDGASPQQVHEHLLVALFGLKSPGPALTAPPDCHPTRQDQCRLH